jgi:hypothetical protein
MNDAVSARGMKNNEETEVILTYQCRKALLATSHFHSVWRQMETNGRIPTQ